MKNKSVKENKVNAKSSKTKKRNADNKKQLENCVSKTKKVETKATKTNAVKPVGKKVAKKETAPSYRVMHEKETSTWVIKKDGSTRVIRRVKTKEEALDVVKGLSVNQGLNVVVHKRNGQFQAKK